MFFGQRNTTFIIMWASGKEQNVFVWVNSSFKSPIMVIKWCFTLYVLYVVLLFHVNILSSYTLRFL